MVSLNAFLSRELPLAALLATASIGCSGDRSVPEDQMVATVSWMDQLEQQVADKQFEAAKETITHLESEGAVPSQGRAEYLYNKAVVLIETGDNAAAAQTIDELARGSDDDDPQVVELRKRLNK